MEELKEIWSNFTAEQMAVVFDIVGEKIVEQAMKDYRKHLAGENNSGCVECEMFFRSSWFYFLRGYDGSIIIEKMRKAHKAGLIHHRFSQQENVK